MKQEVYIPYFGGVYLSITPLGWHIEIPSVATVADDGGKELYRLLHETPIPDEKEWRGTSFQKKVWSALCSIPMGITVSYQEVARRIGMPQAVRAVANAVGANPYPLIIPCHRVIRSSGTIGGYFYGTEMKKALLRWEAEQVHSL